LISVLTPTIPERAAMLEECEASVNAQTYSDVEHLIGLDEERRGCSWTMNQLAKQVAGEWLLPLADDDLLLPGAVRVLLEHAEAADIVYSPPLIKHPASWHFFQEPPFIPSCALIRTSLWRELGGYDEALIREEDRVLWTKALAHGARFVKVEDPQWIYRLHPGNKSFNGGIAA
jgi:glycosyltransferase involved in cell wall biosynthesis